MEGIVTQRLWQDWPEAVQELFRELRSPAGEAMILEQNRFVETMMPRTIIRTLSDEEMEHYRRPFAEAGEGRRPTLTWPRQLPIEGTPADVTQIVTSYSQWLSTSPIPKLFVNGDPGVTLTGRLRDFCRTWPAQSEVTVNGRHFLQEDSPDAIGEAIATWMRGVEHVQPLTEQENMEFLS